MENILKKTAVLLVVLGLSVAGPLAYAGSKGECPKDGSGYRRGGGPEGVFRNINLTAEQKAKLDAQREAQKEKNKAVREQVKLKMQALHEEIAKPVTDPAKINAQVAEINTLKGQLFAQHIEGVLGMKTVLTPEQFAKFEAKRKKHGFGKHEGWKKHHKEGPQGGPDQGPEAGPVSEGPEQGPAQI